MKKQPKYPRLHFVSLSEFSLIEYICARNGYIDIGYYYGNGSFFSTYWEKDLVDLEHTVGAFIDVAEFIEEMTSQKCSIRRFIKSSSNDTVMVSYSPFTGELILSINGVHVYGEYEDKDNLAKSLRRVAKHLSKFEKSFNEGEENA